MSQNKTDLYFIEGIFQKITSLPVGKDAIYFHTPGKPGLIYIDQDFTNRTDIQAMFRHVLLQEFYRLQTKCAWALRGNIYFSVNLAELGLVQGSSGYLALPEPAENRFINISDDITPTWFPENIFKR